MNLIFLDTETTGLSDYDRLCQLAFSMKDKYVNQLYCPPVEIGVEAMSVHHITNKDVRELPAFKDSEEYEFLKKELKKKSTVLVAHNASFDKKMLAREGIEVASVICTLKVAQYLLVDDKKLKRFALQHLRYYLELDVKDAKAHDAAGDIAVLEALFDKLYTIAYEKATAAALEKGKTKPTRTAILARMIEISERPISFEMKMPFGKHVGKLIKDAVSEDPQYFKWLLNQPNESRDDSLTTTVNYFLKHGTKA